ncbi:MAG: GTP-binding protein [Thermostichales cyanobacterium DRC_bins_46]
MGQIPVTILTGFLGSGKTTLLNRLLSGDHGLRIGVILNELGEIPIDGELVRVPESGLLELSNGCLCCTVREDFEQGALQLLAHVDRLDYLLIETTGIADPRQIAEIFVQRQFQEHTRLDSITTVVDAAEFEANLQRADSAYQQISCADILILNKIDLVTPSQQAAILASLRRYNSQAPCLTTTYAQVPLAQLLDVHAFRPEQPLRDPEEMPAAPDHRGIESVSFVLRQPLDFGAFREFLEELPETVFRAKGVIWIAEPGEAWQKVIFHRVGCRQHFFADEGGEGVLGLSKIVLIGPGLPRFSLETRLQACVAHPTRPQNLAMFRGAKLWAGTIHALFDEVG